MAATSPILPVYRRADVIMTRGEGVYLYDENNLRYLDFAAGIAVNSLGHSHPEVNRRMQEQVGKLWHCSNLFQNEHILPYSEKITQLSGLDSVFFCNSGTEAAEAAIKFTRRYHDKTGKPDRYRMIVAQGAYHGRTLAALSACRNPRVIDGYGPLVDTYDIVPFNDISALEKAVTAETGAIMLEPVQGEGGIRPHSREYLQAARAVCDRHNLLLIFDEVQCGLARTGTYFTFQEFGVKPDMLLLGKGLGNGFPLAACLVTHAIAAVMEPGCHGSTFGSNPLAMCAGRATLDVITREGFLQHVRKMAMYLQYGLEKIMPHYPQLYGEWRGMGLLQGVVTKVSAYDLARALRMNGLLLVPAGDGVIRFLPPLIVDESHIEEALKIIEKTSAAWPLS